MPWATGLQISGSFYVLQFGIEPKEKNFRGLVFVGGLHLNQAEGFGW
jgi:hypothetical protein